MYEEFYMNNCEDLTSQKMELQDLINSCPPSQLSKILGRRVETSTRDKKRFMDKVAQIEHVVDKLGYVIQIKEKTN